MIRSFRQRAVPAAAALLTLSLAGCSTVENFLAGDKVDYRTASTQNVPLEVPPDLTQLVRDGRYQPQTGIVSANAMRAAGGTQATAAAAAATVVAPNTLGDVRLERLGNQRWLVTSQTPEQLWPQLRAFWQERGFKLVVDDAGTGVMETDWAEDRARIPNDLIRRTIGRVMDALYSTSTRDRFRTRIERGTAGTEIYVSHRGMEEVYLGQTKDQTTWQPRPNDPQLEAEFLSRLMIKLGAKEDAARAVATASPAATAASPTSAPRARLLANAANTVAEVDEPFDRAWRRVGVSLDRGGFTVEDRDRAAGLYFVRYVDPKSAGKDESNFFTRLFSGSKEASSAVQRFRILVKASGDKTQVTVLNAQGAADTGEAAKHIGSRLVEELR